MNKESGGGTALEEETQLVAKEGMCVWVCVRGVMGVCVREEEQH